MITPATYSSALLLGLVSMLCWGSWANTFKLAGKWRFELFYFDYAIGVLISGVVAAYTFGSLGTGLSFSDNLLVAYKHNIAYALGAGAVFNLGNMLLLGAVSVAGLALAFPVGLGTALLIGVSWTQILDPKRDLLSSLTGLAVTAGAVVLGSIACAVHARSRKPAPGLRDSSRIRPQRGSSLYTKPTGKKGILLSLVGGVISGSFYPLVQMAMGDGIDSGGLGSYAIVIMFSLGVFVSTFAFNLYFSNLPVEGDVVRIIAYFNGTFRQHALGILGGVIWGIGAVACFAAASVPQAGLGKAYAVGQGASIVGGLWGLLAWKELAGASRRPKVLLALALLFLAAGLVLILF